ERFPGNCHNGRARQQSSQGNRAGIGQRACRNRLVACGGLEWPLIILGGSSPWRHKQMVNVSPAAASKISELLTEEGKTGSGLRVFVQGGGCSGFQYGLMIEESGGVGDQVF